VRAEASANASRGQRAEPPAWQSAIVASWQHRARWVLERQIAIAEVAAPTGHERERAAVLRRLIATVGDAVGSMDSAGNVVVQIAPLHIAPMHADGADGTSRASPARSTASLVCMAHLDTVFATDAPLRATIDGSCVRCPGIGDNSRGLAAMLVLAHTLQTPEVRARLTRPVALVATVGEEGEGNLRGARAYFDDAARDGRPTFAAIAVDGPGDSSIVHHAVGSTRLRIHLHGAGGHNWVNAGTPNPVHAAGALIGSLCQLSARERPHALVTVSRMGGGETLTSVPRAAWIDVDVRALDATRLARMHTVITQLAMQAARDESRLAPALALSVAFESLGERPAGRLADSHALVALAADATQRVGRTPRAASASTDANVPLARGIPAIALGAGGTGGEAHTLGEWFDDANSDVGIRRLLDVVLRLATAPDTLFG
jgi:acetylornithine deacetylase/succinyl-diaminopimelate desuccinylase-like protein